MLILGSMNHRMRRSRLEYFGTIWSRYEKQKARKIYILQAFVVV